MADLTGTAIALIARGSERDRAIAVALAEAGADIAIASQESIQEQEFATASIANEVWAIGRDQFSHVMDASDADAVDAYVAEARRRFGRLDVLVLADAADAVVAAAKRAAAVVIVVESGAPAADAVQRIIEAVGEQRA